MAALARVADEPVEVELAGVVALAAGHDAAPLRSAATQPARVFHRDDLEPARLVAAKRGRRVAVCLPAHNEAATVGAIVSAIRHELVDALPLVDDLVVMDDRSTDGTATLAAAAGARVVHTAEVLPELAGTPGKGAALWKSLVVTDAELVVWCDADVVDFDPRFVAGLVGPLLLQPEIALVKGFYERPLHGHRGEGGRVTELVARPALSLLFPHLAGIVQPLGGEYAGRRDVLERVSFVGDYGVELGLLIDVAALVGTGAIAQVDLGVRTHRNRPLAELGPMAAAVLRTALERSRPGPHRLAGTVLHRPGHAPVDVAGAEWPPLGSLRAAGLVPAAGERLPA
ncbi:MAG: glucosyl-3-phosphoglycerate synthase [Acidimicrobiales bacterium]|nr:glucosyl-3-phosphoglycerate synthase [Acidimicrobiales bacterium]